MSMIMDMHLCTGLDWGEPPLEGDQNLEDGEAPHETSMHEWLFELEYLWKRMIEAIVHANGDMPYMGGADEVDFRPEWWVARGAAMARQANFVWHTSFLGSGARGGKSIYGGVDVFLKTGWVLHKGILLDQLEKMAGAIGSPEFVFGTDGSIDVVPAPAPLGSIFADTGAEQRTIPARVRLVGLHKRPDLNER